MIYSTLGNDMNNYLYPEAIVKALNYLKNTDLASLEAGRHEIDGDNMFIVAINLTPAKDVKPETHKKYIDLMYWPNGGETIEIAELTGKETITEELPNNDTLYYANVANEMRIHTTENTFALFFPGDIHRPGVYDGSDAVIRKYVLKISMSLLK